MTTAPSFKQFVELCFNTASPRQLEQLLNFLLTPEERDQLATRVLLTKELLKGEKTQREIARDYHVSIAKITRGSNNLKVMGKNSKAYLEAKLLHKKKSKN